MGFARFPAFRGTINDSFGRPYIERVLCSVIHVCLTRITIEFSDKDFQSRYVIGTEIYL